MQGYTYEQTIKLPNCTARIFRPVLTANEKHARMQSIKNATADLIKGVKK